MKATQRLRLQLAGDARCVLACLITWGTLQGGEFDPRYVGGYDTSGYAVAVAVSGHYAYVADGTNGLQVIDISDPANPRRTGWHSGNAWAVAVSGDFAYLGGETGLQVIDISDPANPREVGTCNAFGCACSVAVSGNHAYVTYYGNPDASSGSGLQVIDVSEPSHPRAVAQRATSDNGAFGVVISGNYAYVADVHAGLQVIDIATPSSPQWIGGLHTGEGAAMGVAVSGNYAYVTGLGWGEGLHVIDIAHKRWPFVAGACYVPGFEAHAEFGLAVVGNYVFLPGDPGPVVIDVSNPASPTRVGAYNAPSLGVAVSRHFLYVACGVEGLKVLEADFLSPAAMIQQPPQGGSVPRGETITLTVTADPAFPAVSYEWRKDGVILSDDGRTSGTRGAHLRIRDVELNDAGEFAVVVRDRDNAETSQLATVRVLQPVAVSPVGAYDTQGRAVGVAVSGNYAYVVDGDVYDGGQFPKAGEGLVVIDVHDPANPQRVGSHDTSGQVRSVAVSGNHAYVADNEAGLQVIDISTPSSPQRIGGYDTGGVWAVGVAVSGNHAYLTDWGVALQVIDVSDPVNPRRVGGCDVYSGVAVAVSGDYAYVASNGGEVPGELNVINVSDPASPHVVGKCRAGYATDVAVSDHYAYVANWSDGLDVIDVSDPANPRNVAGIGTHGDDISRQGVAVLGRYACVADGAAGLRVIDVSDPAKPLWVGGSDVAPEVWDVAVSGNHAYVAAGTHGLRIFAIGPTRARFPLTSLRTLPGGAFGFRVSGEPGQHLELQASEDFGVWTTINTITNTEGHTDLTDPVNGRDRRFYRLRLKE